MNIELLIQLCFGHAISDLALQNEWVGKYKNPQRKYFYYHDGRKAIVWPWVLLGHAMVNGAVVAVIMQDIRYGIAETVFHFIIDYFHCMGHYRMSMDQTLHFFSKVLWVWW